MTKSAQRVQMTCKSVDIFSLKSSQNRQLHKFANKLFRGALEKQRKNNIFFFLLLIFLFRHVSLQNELENNRDGTNRVGSTILAPNSANSSQTTIETANLHKSNDDNKSTPNFKPADNLAQTEKSMMAIENQTKCDTNIVDSDSSSKADGGSVNVNTNDAVIRKVPPQTPPPADCTSLATCDKSDKKPVTKCDGNDDDSEEHSSSSNSDTVFKGGAAVNLTKPNLANLHATPGRLNAPPMSTVVPLSSPPNVPMFVNRFPNTHPTYLPPHIRNLPKTQSLDLGDNEMPPGLLNTKQASFEQNRPIYPNVPYSPYGSPFGSPRNRRRGPLRESRRISIEQSGSFLQLNQYKLMDQIGQVLAFLFNSIGI